MKTKISRPRSRRGTWLSDRRDQNALTIAVLATAASLVSISPAVYAQSAPVGSPAQIEWQNSSKVPVVIYAKEDGVETEHRTIEPNGYAKDESLVGSSWVCRHGKEGEKTVEFTVRRSQETVEVGPTKGLIVVDANYKPALDILFVSRFQWVYDDHDSGANKDCSIWRVHDSVIPAGYHPLGHVMVGRKGNGSDPSGKIAVPIVKDISPNRDAIRAGPTVKRVEVWRDAGSGGTHDVEIYALEAPKRFGRLPGYRSLGCIVSGSLFRGKDELITACLREDLTDDGSFELTWWDQKSGAKGDFMGYTVLPGARGADGNVFVVNDGFVRLASGSFCGVRPFAEGLSDAIATVPAGEFYGTRQPDARFAVVLKFRLPFDENPSVSDLATLPGVEDGWPSEGDRTKWKLANSVRIPFVFVYDPRGGVQYKIDRTPVYTSEKWVCWQAYSPILGSNEGDTEHSFENQVGVMVGSELSYWATTGIKLKSATSTGVKGVAGTEFGWEWSLELGIKNVEKSSVTRTSKHSEKYTLKAGTSAVYWKPMYKFLLRRADGSLAHTPAYVKGELAKRLVYSDAQAKELFVNAGPLLNPE